MTDILTIDGNNRTSNLHRDSLKIEQAAGEFSAVCSFQLNDLDASLTIVKGDAVTVVDDSTVPATTLFAGEVTNVTDNLLSLALDGRRLAVECQDYNILVEEAVIDAEEAYSAEADSDIIDDLFTNYRADIDSTTYVSTIDGSMTITFSDVTLRQALTEMCGLTGGRWYVDEDKALHYFTTEANVAAWYLSDTPDLANSFPYQDIRRITDASPIVNEVLMVGSEVRQWYQDAASVALYGDRPIVVKDDRITTTAGLEDRADAIFGQYAYPRVRYEVVTRKEGLRAGMDVRLVCGAWGIDSTLTVRRLTIYWQGGNRFYRLELGAGVAQAVTGGRVWLDKISNLSSTILEINDSVFDTDAPSTPAFVGGNLSTGVDVDADGHQIVYIQATWGAVGDADLSHYEIQASTSNDFSGYTITRTHAAGGDRIERFVGILGGTTYYFRVRAVDWVGNASAWSGTQSILSSADTDAPGQVVGLSASASRTLVGLSWTANSEADLLEYEIDRADDDGYGAPDVYAQIAKARLNFYIDEDFTDGEIAAEDTFWYRVRAIDTSGNAGNYSADADATLSRINADHITADTITADQIAANTITANEMNVAQLSAISADLGTITAGTVTGATIRTAAAGARIVLDSVNGIQAYNATPVQTVSILPSGAGWIGIGDQIAWNTAGGLTVDGGVLVDGTVVATAFSNTLTVPIFTAQEGLLLLGPHAALTATSWRTSRAQEATISGAFRQVQGRWEGTTALAVEPATTNLVENPVFANNVTDSWSLSGAAAARAQDTAKYVHEDASAKLTAGSTIYNYLQSDAFSVGNGESVTIQAWLWAEDASDIYLYLRDVTNSAFRITEQPTQDGAWQWVTGSWTNDTGGAANCAVWIRNAADDSASNVWIDGVQAELLGYPTNLAYGSMGTGYAWTGDEHDSTTTRTKTQVNLDALVGLVEGNNTVSFAAWAQMPLNANAGTWGAANNYIFDIANSGDAVNNRIFVRFDTADDKVNLFVNGTTQAESAVQTFVKGEWMHFAAVLDFTNDEYELYINGELSDSGTTAKNAISGASNWQVGTQYTGIYQTGFVIAEFAVFDDELTVGEVAALYTLQKPLVDCGAVDTPGIYLFDGQFILASSITGARTQIDVEGIKAFSASAQSVAIEPDGDAFFGSDVSAAATTAFAIFATAQTYNSESMGAGDVLFGDNSANKANMLWDKSAGQLLFRGSTSTKLYIDTDGSLLAGSGDIKITSTANILFSVDSANQGIVWKDNFSDLHDVGYINVSTATYDMTIATGGGGIAGWQKLTITALSSDGGGTTRYPLTIDPANKRAGFYETSPDCTVHIDTTAAESSLKLTQAFGSSTPIITLENAAVDSSKSSPAGSLLVVVNGTTRYINYHS